MRGWTGWLVLGLVTAGQAQVPSGQVPVAPSRTNIKTEAQLDAEAKQADQLFERAQTLATLPLYEDLHAQRPTRTFYTVRLAMAYVAKGGSEASPEASKADTARARQLLGEAKAQGDNSDLTQVMIAKLDEAAAASTEKKGPKPPGREAFDKAEIEFSKGDLKGAAELYAQAWKEDPKFYYAAVFAGDSEYKQNHYEEAGAWFQRAISIEPDRETAHRYWADDLSKAGKTAEAHKQFVEAFVAEPYEKAPRLTLKTWMESHQFRYVPPPVTLPAAPSVGKDGRTNITIDGSKASDQTAPDLAYSMTATLWQWTKFKAAYPKEKAYRHSLAEEMDGLKAMLEVFHGQQKEGKELSATGRTLLALEKDGMLECWILLDNPDQGVAQDYAAYRAGHRDLLKAYVEKYDLHAA